MKTWIFVDVSFLAWRAVHSMGDLSFGAIKTGVIYGFLREVVTLQDRFATTNVAFCFDYGAPKRKQLLECYKQKRHNHVNRTEEERTRTEVRRQLDLLRSEYLNTIGYRNILAEHGFEGDDVIASLVDTLPDDDEAVIVSADHDLFQLLRGNVIIYNPSQQAHAITTLQSFTKARGIPPKKWARVKAMTGCKTDEIPGIPGIGEKTAIKYLLGTLSQTTQAFRRIESDKGQRLIAKNKTLVRLPFQGTPVFELKEDELSIDGWKEVCNKLGMKSLAARAPFAARVQAAKAGFGFKK